MKSELNQEQWDQKVIDLGGSILQSWAWGEFQKSLGLNILRFSDSDYANLVIETPMPTGRKYLYSPKGPIGNVDLALAELRKFSSDRNVVFARIEPEKAVNLPKAAKDTQPTHNWVLDINKSDEQLLAGMKSKHRYNLNLGIKKGVTVREGNRQDILTVYKLLLETANRNAFRLHPQNYYWEMFDNLGPQRIKIFIAEYEGKPLAGLFMTMFGGQAIYLHGGTSQVSKEVMAPYVLHWEAMRVARYLGVKSYDFGGVAPADDPNHPWAGISRFKRGFGGSEITSPGAFDLVFSPLWYNVYKNVRLLRQIMR
jgi:lipid II:glycine glycyltransferase (peptidoglycan interpeptide bridge formation enzyme)